MKNAASQICGNTGLALKTKSATTAAQSICTTQTPFKVLFKTNQLEASTAAIAEAGNQNPGEGEC